VFAHFRNTIAKDGLGANFPFCKKKDLLFNPHGLWKDISMFRWFGFADIYLLIALASVFFCTFAVFDVVFVRIYLGRILVLTCYVVRI
jgi:hypothetical protein